MRAILIEIIVTFVLGYITGVYLPIKFRKEDKAPKISISPFQKRHNYFDITNHGGDILELKIKIFWLQDGKEQEKEMTDFLDSNADTTFGLPYKCNALKKGETKKVMHCPLHSDNGEVKVSVCGIAVDGQSYNEKVILKNEVKK